MTLDSTTLVQTQAPLQRARILRLPRSPKVIVGLVIIGLFTIVAIIGPWIVPYSPNRTDIANWVRHVLVPGTGAVRGCFQPGQGS